MEGKIQRICCIGAGYVGGSTMPVMASFVPDIIIDVVDVNQNLIRAWNSESIPIYEPNLQELVNQCRGKNLFFSGDIMSCVRKAEIIIVAVGTPTKMSGYGAGESSNIRYLESSIRTIRKACQSLESGTVKIIIERSTVPVMTSQQIEKILDGINTEFIVLNMPEFLAEGTAVQDLKEPYRIVIGGPNTEKGKWAMERVASIYANWVPKEKIILIDTYSSELCKLAANCMLAQRVSSINSISAICEAVGANCAHISEALKADPRIGEKYLSPSPGFGGSCLQKDVLNLSYCSDMLGLPEVGNYWRQVVKMNNFQRFRIVRYIWQNMHRNLSGKKILILGFAFKKDTGDCRDSSSAIIASELLKEDTQVSIYDPQVTNQDFIYEMKRIGCQQVELIEWENDPYMGAANSHALIILTEWDAFKNYDYERIYSVMEKPAFIFDTRNILNAEALRKIGFKVYPLGAPAKL